MQNCSWLASTTKNFVHAVMCECVMPLLLSPAALTCHAKKTHMRNFMPFCHFPLTLRLYMAVGMQNGRHPRANGKQSEANREQQTHTQTHTHKTSTTRKGGRYWPTEKACIDLHMSSQMLAKRFWVIACATRSSATQRFWNEIADLPAAGLKVTAHSSNDSMPFCIILFLSIELYGCLHFVFVLLQYRFAWMKLKLKVCPKLHSR